MGTDGTFTGLCELELVYVPSVSCFVLKSARTGHPLFRNTKGEPGPKAGPPAFGLKLFICSRHSGL
jgi:hypothetical protein